MFLFLDISIVFCVYFFPVDLEVFYLGHFKKIFIQYNTTDFSPSHAHILYQSDSIFDGKSLIVYISHALPFRVNHIYTSC